MPYLTLIVIVFLSPQLMAVEARVLVDETSLSHTFVGQFQVRCIPFSKKQTCTNKKVSFVTSEWLIKRTKTGLLIANKKNKKRIRLRGLSFEFFGEFKLSERPLKKLHLYLLPHKTHWVLYLPVDQYLYGVMASEVPVSWPMETLKAQAIASRTYFLFKKMERLKKHFDVRATTLDQVFSMNPKKHHSIIKAVDQTHGKVLVSEKKEEIFPAYFHADCGGGTSKESHVWRRPSSLNEQVQDPYCKTAKKNNWSYLIDKNKLMLLLQKAFYLPAGVELQDIMPRASREGRSHIVDFLFSGEILKRMSANDLRKLLGFTKLKSTRFQVKSKWNEFKFSGRGFGHGVGMCQWGAQRWARKGKSSQFILNHYYPGAKVRKIDAGHLKSLQAQLVY